MTKYKDNHVVPAMLLRRFAGPTGLWHFDRRKPGYTIRRRNPERVFTRRRATVLLGADGQHDASVEALLGLFESDISRVLTDLIPILRRRSQPNMHKDIRDLLVLLVLYQEKRAVLAHGMNPEGIDVANLVEAGIADFIADHGSFPDEDLKIYRSPEVQQDLLKRFRLSQMIEITPEMIEAIDKCGLFFAATRGLQRFVIGTDPVFIDTGSNYRLLPIAPDLALLIGEAKWEGKYVSIPDNQVVAINFDVWQRSHEIAGHCQDVVHAVVYGMSADK